MDLSGLIDARTIVTAILIGGGSFVVGWGRKVNNALNDTVKSASALHERLNGHEELDNARFEALRDRLDDLRLQHVEPH